MQEASPQSHPSHRLGTGAAGTGMTIVSAVIPALGIPVPHWVLWLAFAVGVVLMCWSPIKTISKVLRKMDAPQILMTIGMAGVILSASAALGGMFWRLSRENSTDSQVAKSQSELGSPKPDAGKADAATTTPDSDRKHSILVSTRYYSAKNKEEVAERLDRISDAIHKADQDILRPAELALLPRFMARPASEARGNIEKLDEIETAIKKMNDTLYGDLLANEREYRAELAGLLLPKEPVDEFTRKAKEYRNSIEVWMKLGSSIADDGTSRGFRDMVSASSSSFSRAKKDLVEWLSQRQELVGKARADLRS